MNKTELIAALARYRTTKLARSQGLSDSEIEALIEQVLPGSGISDVQALSMPEGTIVSIVESYLQFVARETVRLGGSEHFSQASTDVISAIESHRSAMGAKGSSNFPKTIDEYVFYRVKLELYAAYGKDAADFGLDELTVKELTHTAKANLIKMTQGGTSQAGGSKFCFIATACLGSPDDPTVMVLRRFRDEVLRISPLGRNLIYCYYKLSPRLARCIQERVFLKKMTAKLLRLLSKAISVVFRV